MTEHEAYYKLVAEIKTRLKDFSDEDLRFAYFLHYEGNGLFESAVVTEYTERKHAKDLLLATIRT